MKLKARRVDPGCGWARFSVSPVPRKPGFFLDLGQQALRFVPESGPARAPSPLPPLAALLDRVDDTFWLPVVEDVDWRSAALDELRGRQLPRVVEAEAASVSPGEEEVVVQVPAHELLDQGELPPVSPGGTLIFPWVPGFTAREDVWRHVLEQAKPSGAAALVVVRPELDDSAKRELARRCTDDRQYSEFFHATPEDEDLAVRRARAVIREAGLATVVERALPAGPERLRRNRRVAAALLTAAETSQEMTEARQEEFSRAARWIENEQRDLLAIAADGNLKVLDWLPHEAHDLVRQVLEAGDGFRLADFEAAYCSKTPM